MATVEPTSTKFVVLEHKEHRVEDPPIEEGPR